MSPGDSTHDSGTQGSDGTLGEVIAEYIRGVEAGTAPEREELLARYPELASELEEFLRNRDCLENLARPLREAVESGSGCGVNDNSRLGDYRIVREIGRGGMGVVYEAEQFSLARRVALKLLPGRPRDTERLRRRFELEARTAARLHHPHIVAVYEFGEADGLAFYAMQIVNGSNLGAVVAALRRAAGRLARSDGWSTQEVGLATELAEALRAGAVDGRSKKRAGSSPTSPSSASTRSGSSSDLPAPGGSSPTITAPSNGSAVRDLDGSPGRSYFASVARIGALVADALAHAHAAGVVHRDIKPSNLLLDREGKVWIADFGLAKLDDGESLTRSGDAVGTLRYMGPERFRGWSDPRSDVYSLGATLYELATLRPPFDETDRANLVKEIISHDPVAPRRLDPRMPRDLETVILKCLEKEPEQRYAGAGELRDDLERFVDGRPVLARRANALERAWLFSRRNPLVSGLVAGLAIVAIVAGVIALRLYRTSDDLEVALAEAQLERARASLQDLDPEIHGEVLQQIGAAARRLPTVKLRSVAIPWLGRLGLATDGEELPVAWSARTAISPDGDRLVVGDSGGFQVRDLRDGTETRVDGCGPGEAWSVFYSQDGRYLCRFLGGNTEIIRVADGECAAVVPGNYLANEHSFHPTRPLVATSHGGSIFIHDLTTGDSKEVPSWAAGARSFVYGPAGERAATIDASARFLRVRDIESGKILQELDHATLEVARRNLTFAAWHPGGRLIATGPRPLVLWDLDLEGVRFKNADVEWTEIVFSPDGEFLATSSWGELSRLWDPEGGELFANLQGFAGFRSDSRALFLRGASSLSVAAIEPGVGHRILPIADSSVLLTRCVAVDPTGRWLAVARDTGVYLRGLGLTGPWRRLPLPDATWVGWRPDGSELVTVSGAAGIWRWAWSSEAGNLRVGPAVQFEPASPRVWGHAAVAASGHIAFRTRTEIIVTHLDRPEFRLSLRDIHEGAARLSMSDDGRFVAAGNDQYTEVRVWNVETNEVVWKDPAAGKKAQPLFLSSDRLYVGTLGERRVLALEAGTWKVIDPVAADGRHAAVSADGTTLAVRSMRSASRVIELLTVEGGSETPTLRTRATFRVDANAHAPALGPRGQLLAVMTEDGGPVHIWRLDALRPRLREMGLDWEPPLERSAAKAPSGEREELEVDLGELAPDDRR